MPTYGYRCTKCGHELEVLQKITDPPLKTCPECGGELAKKVYAAGVIFKGSGYYTTDYKNSKSSSDSGTSNGSESGADKPAEKAADSNPAAESKPEPKAESKAESKPSKSDSSD